MNEIAMTKNDELVMRLLHYFITEKGYNPIILHGAKNEVWLENLDSEYKIVRIVSNYIHNDEQFNFDLYKTRQIMKKIKHKTFSFQVNTLSIFINLGDNVHLEEFKDMDERIAIARINEIEDLGQYEFVTKEFPDILEDTTFKEKGMELFMKITKDLNDKNEETSLKMEEVFKSRKPVVTYILIGINVIVFLLMYILGYQEVIYYGANIADNIRGGEYYRLLTSAFLHSGILHLACNMYCLYVVGPQLESFFGKWKFLMIYIGSALTGNLMSMLFANGASIGASGAIFGLFGALIYFGYHYRVYLGGVMKSQIIPLVLLNLMLGFVVSGIDNAAHIGGLIGGLLISMAVGVKYKSENYEKVNGWIMSIIYIVFLLFMAFKGL